MDLNEFIFRDDAVEALGVAEDEDFGGTEESTGSIASHKVGLAAIGSAVLGMSHFLGHVTKHL